MIKTNIKEKISDYKKMNATVFPKDLIPLAERDQHFCIDQTILEFMVQTAEITKEDVVLEIGAGLGNLTVKIAEKAKKVIAIENDSRFEKKLLALDGNVQVIMGDALVIIGDALEYHKQRQSRSIQRRRNFSIQHGLDFSIQQKLGFNKIIANLPYQICEPLMHLLCRLKEIKLSVLTVPKQFAEKVKEHPVFSAFLDVKLLKDVPKTAFYQPPRVASQIIKVIPRVKLNDDQFLRQKLYLQKDKKLKNGLRDALIDWSEWKKKRRLTKKEADKIISSFDLPNKLLITTIARMHPRWYREIWLKINNSKEI